MTSMENIVILFCVAALAFGDTIVNPPENATSLLHETADFSCGINFNNNLSKVMTWQFNRKTIYNFDLGTIDYPNEKYHYPVRVDGSTFILRVTDVSYEAGGTYTCIAGVKTQQAVLIVLGEPTLLFPEKTPEDNDTALYICKAQFGGPRPDMIAPQNYPFLTVSVDGVDAGGAHKGCDGKDLPGDYHLCVAFSLKVDAEMHKKKLKCEVRTNRPAKAVATVSEMHVLYPVRALTYAPRLTLFEVGLAITCEADGNPEPRFQWKNENDPEIVIKGAVLNITDAMRGSNVWRCTANNSINGSNYEDSTVAEFHVGLQNSGIRTPLLIIVAVGVGICVLLITIRVKHSKELGKLYQEKVSGRFAFAAITCVLGSAFPHGYNMAVMNLPQDIVKRFIGNSFEDNHGYPLSDVSLELCWGFTVAIYLLGGLIAHWFSDLMADRFGRKRAMQLSIIPVFISALLMYFCQMANSFEMLIFGRFVAGLGCGLSNAIGLRYLIEITPHAMRSNVLIFHQLASTCGIVVSQILGLPGILGTESHLTLLLALMALPCIASCLALRWCPETPRHLLKNCETEDAARDALKILRKEEAVSEELRRINSNVQRWSSKQLWDDVTLRRSVILICFLALCQQMSGINILFYYSYSVIVYSGMPAAHYGVLVIGVFNIVMTGYTMTTKWERKNIFIWSLLTMVISGILNIVGLNIVGLHPDVFYCSIIALVLFDIGFAVEFGAVLQVIGAVLFAQGPRSPATFWAELVSWVANFCVAFIFPCLLLVAGPNCMIIFLVFIIIFFIGFGSFFHFKLPVAGRNQNLEEQRLPYGLINLEFRNGN